MNPSVSEKSHVVRYSKWFAVGLASTCWYILSYLGSFEANAAVSSGSWEAKQEIWWKEDSLVKAAIISVNAVAQNHSELLVDKSFIRHMSDVSDLILLFDAMSSERSIETLASLAPYYLGESAGELYSCVVRRKGHRIKLALDRMLKLDSNECISKFGVPPAESQGTAKLMCLSEKSYRARLKSLLAEISKETPCTIEH